jgi:hypothetical protein
MQRRGIMIELTTDLRPDLPAVAGFEPPRLHELREALARVCEARDA